MLFSDSLRRGLLGCLFGWAVTFPLLGPALEAAVPVAPYFNGVFPVVSPDVTGWTTENAFPNLTFVDPLWVGNLPGTNELVVVEKNGFIRRFPNNPAATTAQMQVVLDLSASVQVSEDQGLYRIAFHPQFGQAGSSHANEVFVTYSHRPAGTSAGPDNSLWRLSRFLWQPATGTIDPASESVLIQQYDPHRWHNGGAMAFDSSGYMYITCGDGGGANGTLGLVQKQNAGLFGGVLRIDVDNNPARSHAIRRQPTPASGGAFGSFTQGYGIPNDNPWLNTSGTILEEFYALGLRSPHSMSFDPVTGEIWVGDVGQSSREELNLIKRGCNYEWPFMEGTLTGPASKSSFTVVGTETPPVYSYDRTIGGCVLSGGRYQGAKWSASLGGSVLFADNIQGILRSMKWQPNGGPPVVRQIVSGLGSGIYRGISGVCTDAAGEIYLLRLNGQSQPGGTILKLVSAATTPQPPALLSATGLFSDTAGLVPSPALMPYEVASPLWSDGAAKRRWLIVPNDGQRNLASERILYSASGNWSFPEGSVFVKHFEMPVDERNPSVVKRLETRVMVCAPSGDKYGLTYRWNEQGTDAVLLTDGAEDTFAVTKQDGSTETRTWSYPSRANCLQCHSEASGQALGLRTHQMNPTVQRPVTGEFTGQLRVFNEDSLFTTTNETNSNPTSLTAAQLDAVLESRRIDDVAAPLEHRVRSYLDSNCAHCHQPDAAVPYFDARLQTPLKSQRLMNEVIRGQFNLPGGCYLKAGDPSLSAVLVRTASAQPGVMMPPLAKHVVDDAAVAAMTEYLQGVTASEFAADPLPQARYVRFTATQGGTAGMIAVAEFSALDGTGTKIPGATIEAFTNEAVAGNSSLAIDGDPGTYWYTTSGVALPKSITLDLESVREIGGMQYVPRQDASTGRPTSYQVHYSLDGVAWTLMTSASGLGTSATQTYTGLIGQRKVRSSLAAAPVTAARDFPVTIVFDSPVTGFIASDLQVTGGSVTSLRGSGYYFVAMVQATQPAVTVSLPADRVTAAGYGNSASQVVSIQSGLDTPPVPTFITEDSFHRATEMRLVFDKPYSGITKEDFTVTGGTLEWLIPDGDAWRLIIATTNSSQVTVRLREGAVMGANGLQMGGAVEIAKGGLISPQTEREAESFSGFGFASVADASASNGAYLWVPEGARGTDTTAATSFSISRNVSLRYAGNYRLRAWTRADNLTSDSFHVRIGSSGPILPWRCNQGPGEVGSGQFHPGFAKDTGADHVFALPSGSFNLEVYAAEDGARIDRLSLIPERPYAIWSGRAVSTSPTRTMTLTFTSPVTGLSLADFEAIDGQITSLSGSGQQYEVTLVPDADKMAVRVKEHAVTDEFGATSLRSDWNFMSWVDSYEQWCTDQGLSSLAFVESQDADMDGLDQLTEYALGLDPKVPDLKRINPADPASRGLPWLGVTGSGNDKRLTMIFHRRRSFAAASYAVEFSGNLSQFDRQTDFSGRTEVIDIQWERVTVQDTTATGSEPARFGRLVFKRSP